MRKRYFAKEKNVKIIVSVMMVIIMMVAAVGCGSGGKSNEGVDSDVTTENKVEEAATEAPEIATTETEGTEIIWDDIENIRYGFANEAHDGTRSSFDYLKTDNEITLQEFNWDSITDENEIDESVEKYLWVIKCSDETKAAVNDFIKAANECTEKGTALNEEGKKEGTLESEETGTETVEHEWRITKTSFEEVLQCCYNNESVISFYMYDDGKMYAEYFSGDISWRYPVDDSMQSRVNRLVNSTVSEIETNGK